MRRSFYKLTFLVTLMAPFLLIPAESEATHNRAGEITYERISQNTIRATLHTYTDTRSMAADRPQVEIFWGDNTSSVVDRSSQADIGDFIFENQYTATHTYPGSGTYTISYTDPNRVDGVTNMANSINTRFHVQSTLRIDALRGSNNSVQLFRKPVDFAAVGERFVHNPSAYDPDGDSIHYRMVTPKTEDGENVAGYFLPTASNEFSLNSQTGQLVWDAPTQVGIYDLAIEIREFRDGVLMGSVLRDMQVIVDETHNRPPVIENISDTCVNAGLSPVLDFRVYASDPNQGDEIKLDATGGPFIHPVEPATMTPDPARGENNVDAGFRWEVKCDHIRRWPYLVVFRAEDNHNRIPLADKETYQIQVIGPEPEDLIANPIGESIELNWEEPACGNQVTGYVIYRRAQPSGWNPGTCEPGIPGVAGFRAIDTITTREITQYRDDNNGNGLVPGVDYCYRVTALYIGYGQYEVAEGLASNEICQELIKDIPVITHADIEETDTEGRIYIEWSKPTDLDTTQHPGPYRYEVLHTTGNQITEDMNVIADLPANTFSELNDTSFIHEPSDTENEQHIYRIALFATVDGEDFEVGKSQAASTIRLDAQPEHAQINLSWQMNHPWENEQFTVFRLNDTTGEFDSVTTVNSASYSDTGRVIGNTYCYYVKAYGTYNMTGFAQPFLNNSQVICEIAVDTTRPCPPNIQALARCDEKENHLTWEYSQEQIDSCAADVESYRIYNRSSIKGNMQHVGSISSFEPMEYTDQRPELRESLAGCYSVTALNRFGFESDHSNIECVDNCPVYELPNVFSPTGDNINDYFTPKTGFRFVEKVDFRVYDRWGRLVYETTDPQINWDGTDIETGNDLEAGTYFYICRVYEKFLLGNEHYKIQGTISLMR